jgi:hypothetical protein
MGYLQIKKPVRMAISHASKGLKRDKSAGTCWYIENRKNLDQPVVRVAGYYSIPAASQTSMN